MEEKQMLYYMSVEEKKKAAEHFISLHQALTKPCEFTYEIRNEQFIVFKPAGDNKSLHKVKDILLFAQYYNADAICEVVDGKPAILVI